MSSGKTGSGTEQEPRPPQHHRTTPATFPQGQPAGLSSRTAGLGGEGEDVAWAGAARARGEGHLAAQVGGDLLGEVDERDAERAG